MSPVENRKLPVRFCSRRHLLALAASASLLPATRSAQSQAQSVAVATMVPLKFPGPIIASCAQLNAIVDAMRAEIATIDAGPEAFGKTIFQRVNAQRTALTKSIAEAEKAIKDAKFEQVFQWVGFGIGTTMLALGFLLNGPLALGLLAGTTVLINAAQFGVQAYHYGSGMKPAMLVRAGVDRSIMFGQLGVENAAKAGAKIASGVLSGALLLISASDAFQASHDQASARKSMESAIKNLKQVQAEIATIGNDPKAWAAVYRMYVDASRNHLKGYIALTAGTDCRLPDGPSIVKP